MLKTFKNALYNCIHGGYWYKMYLEYYDEASKLHDEVDDLRTRLRAADDTIEALEAQLRFYRR